MLGEEGADGRGAHEGGDSREVDYASRSGAGGGCGGGDGGSGGGGGLCG